MFTLSPEDIHSIVIDVYASVVIAALFGATGFAWARRQVAGRFFWPDPATQLKRVIGAVIVSVVTALAAHTLPPAVIPSQR